MAALAVAVIAVQPVGVPLEAVVAAAAFLKVVVANKKTCSY